MTVLTVTPLPATAAIRVQITEAADGPLTITRTDANGANPVRLVAGQEVAAGALTVVDYEPALSGPVTYAAAGASATTEVGAAEAVLMVTGRPNRRALIPRTIEWDESQAAGAIVHHPIGRDDDPIVIVRPMRPEVDTVTVWCASYADAAAIRDTVAPGDPIVYRDPTMSGLDRWGTITGRAARAAAQSVIGADGTPTRRWTVTLTWTATPPPPGELLAAFGWTIADVATTHETIAEVAAGYPSIRALTVGP